MTLLRAFRNLIDRLLFAPLAILGLRRRLVFTLKQRHFSDLGLMIPIGGGLSCPILAEENFYSFREIFADREYAGLVEHVPLPQRWIDLGAHAGYFTLALAALHAARGDRSAFEAVMVEPDPRMLQVIRAGLAINRLEDRIRIMAGLVGDPSRQTAFILRSGMTSSALQDGGSAIGHATVPTITEEMLLEAFAPPYDLVKLDIEGSEYDFVRRYRRVCQSARALVLEWHAPHAGDERLTTLRDTLRTDGFTQRIVLHEARRGMGSGPLAMTGLDLFLRE